jgi:HNH endonuclease
MGKWGTGTISQGYHVSTVNGRQKLTHRHIVEQILGKELPSTVIVHHVDGDRLNNSPSNLVVCQDAAYHRLIHQRERALDACGNANWHRCIFCDTWDAPEALKHNKAQYAHFHSACRAKYRRERGRK